jgi:hypothetical protein
MLSLSVAVSSISDPDSFIPDRIQHVRLSTDPDLIWVQDFDDKKFKKFTAEKIAIYLSLGLCKGVQATRKAFISQKRTFSISKHEIS